jgi:RNA polymerase sigma-70 factor (ECF subfamily)
VTEDEALIRAAQAGDGEAFEQLLESYYDTIYRFAYKWCGNRADAEDVTQQACLKAARSLSSFRFESAFSSWLYRLVINCGRDWSRSQERYLVGDEEIRPDDAPAVQAGPDHQVYLRQLLEQLDAMPDGIKETILLVHAEGLTHGQAAQVLDIKESTVSWRLHEFRKHYRLSGDQGGICESI